MSPEQEKLLLLATARKRAADAAQPQQSDSALTRFGTGMRDTLEGGAQDLSHLVPKAVEQGVNTLNDKLVDMGVPLARMGAGGMDALEKQREAGIKKATPPGTDWARMAGNVASTLGVMPELGPAKAAGALARLGKGVAGGMGAAGLQPVTGGKDFAQKKAGQLKAGALGGAAGGAAVEGAARTLAPQLKGAVKKLLDEGVILTPGQLGPKVVKQAESALKSIPLFGGNLRAGLNTSIESFTKAVLNRVLKPLGEKLPKDIDAGRSALNHTEETLSDRYDALLPKLSFKMDPKTVKDLADLDAATATWPKQLAKQYKGLWNQIVEPRFDKTTGAIDGGAFKTAESKLSQLSRSYKKSMDPLYRNLGYHIDELRGVMRDGLARTNPVHAKELNNINYGWAMFSKARDASIRRMKAGEEPGLFTPGDLLRTIRSSNPKSVFARGDALLQDLAEAGHRVIPDMLPDSGTTERALWTMLLSGGATVEPNMAAAGLAASVPYTKPVMAGMAKVATPGATRTALRKGAQQLVPSAGTASGAVAGSN